MSEIALRVRVERPTGTGVRVWLAGWLASLAARLASTGLDFDVTVVRDGGEEGECCESLSKYPTFLA
jgi:hypothetical protein